MKTIQYTKAVEIQTTLIGTNYRGCEETEELLTKIVGHKARLYDNCIDDGVDDDETEDTYVMKACFEFEGVDGRVRVYYGNVTEEIGYVSVDA